MAAKTRLAQNAMTRTLDTTMAMPAAALAFANGYLHLLLAAAAVAERSSRAAENGRALRFVVLIPGR